MREYTKALEVIQEAVDIDKDNKHVKETSDQLYKCQQALMTQRQGETEQETLERAMRDPEVAVSVSVSRLFGDCLGFGFFDRAS